MDQEAALRQQAEIAARNERRQIIANEIGKVTKCDGSDPTLVRQWIQEIQLARGLPDNAAAIELIQSTLDNPALDKPDPALVRHMSWGRTVSNVNWA